MTRPDCPRGTRILFYDDSGDFGGHETMTLLAVEYLAQRSDISVAFLYAARNTRLEAALKALQRENPKLALYTTPCVSQSFQGLRTLLSPGQVRATQRLIADIAPDLVVAVQGSIEISSLGLVASVRSGVRTLSYIPYAHPLRVTGAALAGLRDRINPYLYGLPDGYITVSDSMKESLRRQNARAPISVVYNGIETNCLRREDREASRRALNLPADAYVVGTVGRVHFKQKAHDLLMDALAAHRAQTEDIVVLVVGDGPDLGALKERVTKLDLQAQARFVPWSKNLSPLYSAMDVLAMPSRYEGLPLVMLEAMYLELPIVASNRDGMKDLLPPDWLFETDNARALIETLLKLKAVQPAGEIAANRQRVSEYLTREKFQEAFFQAVCPEDAPVPVKAN